MHRRRPVPRSVAVGADDLAPRLGGDGPPGLRADAVLDEPDRAAEEAHVHASGGGPQFYDAGDDWDAVPIYIGVGEVRLGETVIARLSFLGPEAQACRVFEGMPFLIREGNRIVGYGRVTRRLALPRASPFA